MLGQIVLANINYLDIIIFLQIVHRRLGWGESNRELVPFRFARACLRARGLVAPWNSIAEVAITLFSFSFWVDELSLFLSPHPKPPIQL